ncbi:TraR/DksA family transcriptional regulator [Vibrio sp. PNB22_3_1]
MSEQLDYEKYKVRLQDAMKSCISRCDELREELLEVNAEVFTDELDKAQRDGELAQIRGELDRLDKQIGRQQYALRLIEEGEYGWCEECGCDIDLQRLDSRPESVFCVHCQEVQERNERLYAGK